MIPRPPWRGYAGRPDSLAGRVGSVALASHRGQTLHYGACLAPAYGRVLDPGRPKWKTAVASDGLLRGNPTRWTPPSQPGPAVRRAAVARKAAMGGGGGSVSDGRQAQRPNDWAGTQPSRPARSLSIPALMTCCPVRQALCAQALAEAHRGLAVPPRSSAVYAVRFALRELGRRVISSMGQLERLDELIVPLVTARAAGLPQPARVVRIPEALLLGGVRGPPLSGCQRRPAWLLCAVSAPIPPRIVGKVPPAPLILREPRLPVILWRLSITRMSFAPGHPRPYFERRTKKRGCQKEIIRFLKRLRWPVSLRHLALCGDSYLAPGAPGPRIELPPTGAGLRTIRRPPGPFQNF